MRVDKATHAIAEGLNIVVTTPVVEVYLKDAPGDDRQLAALAPPWSTVPWHLLVLMEEAVARSYAAFSQEEAARRRVPWLDLVRDPTLRTKLRDLIAQIRAGRLSPRTARRTSYPPTRRGRAGVRSERSPRRTAISWSPTAPIG